MKKKNRYTSRSYGKMTDYADAFRKRSIRKEIILWVIEIAAVVIVAFAIAYYLW